MARSSLHLTGIATAIAVAAVPQSASAKPVSASFDAFDMFSNAVPMVQVVMVLLVLASVASWALFVAKSRDIATGIRAADRSARTLHAADRLADIGETDTCLAEMAEAARIEMKKSAELILLGRIDGARDRIEDRIARIEHAMVAHMRRGLPFFASVGSVAPFVGLFGTVWGIMHSFAGIAQARSTSLAVVAPGIAEALMATALGLIAAIPATIMYNMLGRRLASYREKLGDDATLLACLVGREMEQASLAGALPSEREGSL